MSDRRFHDPGELRLETRGLADGTLRFDRGDVVRAKVLPAYTQMLLQRGRYLAFFKQHERAIAAFEQALALDPNLKPAQDALAASQQKRAQPQ
jgi:tetratricopeptide (TPR) repeat protein